MTTYLDRLRDSLDDVLTYDVDDDWVYVDLACSAEKLRAHLGLELGPDNGTMPDVATDADHAVLARAHDRLDAAREFCPGFLGNAYYVVRALQSYDSDDERCELVVLAMDEVALSAAASYRVGHITEKTLAHVAQILDIMTRSIDVSESVADASMSWVADHVPPNDCLDLFAYRDNFASQTWLSRAIPAIFSSKRG